MRYFGRFLTKFLISVFLAVFLMGCASTITRTGYKTFVLEGNVYKEKGQKELAEKYLDRDASKLCHGRYKIIEGAARPLEEGSWRYVYEVECLGEVNEEFYNLHKEMGGAYYFIGY